MKVSVVISNRNDTSMLAVTLRSCLEEFKPLKDEAEIVICDNSNEELQQVMETYLPMGYVREKKIRIYYQKYPCLFTAREKAIKEAKGEYVLCVDSHMIIGRNMILDLVNFMDKKDHGRGLGFAHAPINWIHQHERLSKHDRDMSVYELGDWGKVHAYEQMMTWKGMPWICRKDFFEQVLNGYGALSEHRVSWGGGDMHIGIKPWLLGYPNWAVPTSPAIHIGPFPKPKPGKGTPDPKAKYRLYGISGSTPTAMGFLISCYVLGGVPMMERNKDIVIDKFGRYVNVESEWDNAIKMGQKEKDWLDSVKVCTFEQLLEDKPWELKDVK